MRRARSRLLGLTILLGGCTTLSGIDGLGVDRPPLQGDGAAEGPPESEAGASSGGARASSSSGSGSAVVGPDADANDDGGAVAPRDDGGGVRPPYCATLSPAPTSCDGFDDGLLGSWEAKTAGSGQASVDTTFRLTGTGSALLRVPSAGGRAWLSRRFAVTAQSLIHLGFSIHPATIDAPSGYEIAVVHLGAYELQLERHANGDLNIEEEQPLPDGGSVETNRLVGTMMPLGAWMRVDIRIVFGAGTSALEVKINGAVAYQAALSAHLYNAAPAIQIGYDSSANATTVHVDDVVVDVK